MDTRTKTNVGMGAALVVALVLIGVTNAAAVQVGGYDKGLSTGDLEWRLDWDQPSGLEWLVTNRDTVPHSYRLEYTKEDGSTFKTSPFEIEPGGRHEVANDIYVIGNRSTPKATLYSYPEGKRIDSEQIREVR